uniref:SANTA domain-containing protein n=1 Tax=Panagrellus redivivus TaxID=6233 RepID=A0A7E4VU14_PANRE
MPTQIGPEKRAGFRTLQKAGGHRRSLRASVLPYFANLLTAMPPKTTKPPKQLIKWIPRVVDNASCLLVVVEGYLPGAEDRGPWTTTTITKASKPRELVTSSGSSYFLSGHIDVQQCEGFGYPQAFIDAFYNGFPERWAAIMNELYKFLTHEIDIFGSSLPFSLNNDFETPTTAKSRNKKEITYTSTPNTVVASRYGRTIKPRLANWAGQHIVYDKHGNIVEASHGNPSKGENVDSRAFTRVCDSIGIGIEGRPQQLAIEPTPVARRKAKETPVSSQPTQKKRRVHHCVSSDEDDEVLVEATPIVISRAAQKKRKARNMLLESSDEDERIEEPEVKPRKKRAPAKKAKPAPLAIVQRRIQFPKHNDSLSTIGSRRNGNRSRNGPVVEYPESEVTTEDTVAMSSMATTVAAPTKKRWTEKEKQSLLKILNAKNPITEQDWESVTRSFGVAARPTSAYIEMAKKLRWQFTDVNGLKHNIAVGAPSNDNLTSANLSTINENDDPENANVSFNMAVTAKPGTANFLLQADRINRQMMAQPQKAVISESKKSMNTSADDSFNYDDSLYAITVTQADIQKHTKRPNFLHNYLPEVSKMDKSLNLDDTVASDESEEDMMPGPSRPANIDPTLRNRELRRAFNAFRPRPQNGAIASRTGNQSTFIHTDAPAMDSLFPALSKKDARSRLQRELLDEELEERRPEFSDEEDEEDEGDLI